MTEYFVRAAIKAISEDIHPDVLVKLREKARGMSLQDQLDMLTEEAMKTYKEPDLLSATVKPDPIRDGKMAASGD
ncbi:MAG: hypothetical protein ABR999_11000 [Methanoregula sp.]|jgi:hypothetical protein|uniref:hypothetical protein n=1 Tax=Methanoregula sp. TaxID=2052170 RepID=UPI003D12581A